MLLQGKAICHRVCWRQWRWQKHKPGQDCILAGAKQDDGEFAALVLTLPGIAQVGAYAAREHFTVEFCAMASRLLCPPSYAHLSLQPWQTAVKLTLHLHHPSHGSIQVNSSKHLALCNGDGMGRLI